MSEKLGDVLAEHQDGEWVPFWFESGYCWGQINNREDWLEKRSQYLEAHKKLDPWKCKQANYSQDGMPHEYGSNFGFRGEHQGAYTLGHLAEEFGMNLDP